jgi:RHH-type transcriptional regulator, proline utilization regulon repressor / proline dehydrogenase / delta 1-pyrroline-5-carboxylate dehydrogenase
VKRLGEPVIRTAVARAMKEMGRQFVLGETIDAAMKRATELEAKGYTYSYDMLGEAARTEADARRYHLSLFPQAITAIAGAARSGRHPRQPRHLGQAVGAASALRGGKARPGDGRTGAARAGAGGAGAGRGMGFNIDAEEADRWRCRSR